MSNLVSVAFIALAGGQLLGTIAYLINAGRLLRRLEADHPAVHKSIGQPLLFMRNTPRSNVLFFRWLWNREFEDLSNPGSVALARLVRSQLVWLLFGFASLVAMFAVFNPTL